MISTLKLLDMKKSGEKITMLTAYDASFARLMDEAGVDVLLVGDSLGMVIQGKNSTIPVSLEDMVYHTKAVSCGVDNALVLSDLSFGTYEMSKEQAFLSASRLLQAGAQMVKLEGGLEMIEATSFLSERGIPVCAHIGLTPQSVHSVGGYKVQGRGSVNSQRLLYEAKAHENAGASMLVIECIPADLAKEIRRNLEIPVIGIGAGKDCDGQVLVMHDMLGVYPKPPKFVKNFMQGASSIEEAFKNYVEAVKKGDFPAEEHSYS